MTDIRPASRTVRLLIASAAIVATFAALPRVVVGPAHSADGTGIQLAAARSALVSRSVRSPARASTMTSPGQSGSDVLATRPLPSRTILQAGDLRASDGADPALARMQIDGMIGRETLVSIPAGGALGPEDVGDPALVERNELVTLSYTTGGLAIRAIGRALDRGSRSALVRAMNLDSRRTVTGRVAGKGLIEVSQP